MASGNDGWARDPISVTYLESKDERYPEPRIGIFFGVTDLAAVALSGVFSDAVVEAVQDLASRAQHVEAKDLKPRYISSKGELKARTVSADEAQANMDAAANELLETTAEALGMSVQDLKAQIAAKASA